MIVSPIMVQGEFLKVNNFSLVLHLPAAFSSQSLTAKQSVFIFDDKEAVLTRRESIRVDWGVEDKETRERTKVHVGGQFEDSEPTEIEGQEHHTEHFI